MAPSPKTPVKTPVNNRPATPGLTRATSAQSPATPATPAPRPEPETPTPAVPPGKSLLKSSLKQRVADAASKKAADDLGIEIPPWDRTAELVWTKGITTSDNKLWDDELSFQENSVRMAASDARLRPSEFDTSAKSRAKRISLMPPKQGSEETRERRDISGKDNGLYFKLPDRVRFKISKRIVMSHSSGKPIRLNHPVFLRPIWPVNSPPWRREPPAWTTEYFDSLESVLTPLDRYLMVCFAMRIDILTTLFLTRRFHVVFSSLVMPMTSPLATRFLDKYGVYMKWINLEIDLSKFGGNFHPAAAPLSFGLPAIRAHMERFVEGQLSRRGGTTLQSLIIMVRRYHGFRPGTDGLTTETKPLTNVVGNKTTPEVQEGSEGGKTAARKRKKKNRSKRKSENKENKDPELNQAVGESSTPKPQESVQQELGSKEEKETENALKDSQPHDTIEHQTTEKSEEESQNINDTAQELAGKLPNAPHKSTENVGPKSKRAEKDTIQSSMEADINNKSDETQSEPQEPKVDKGKGRLREDSGKHVEPPDRSIEKGKEPIQPSPTAPVPQNKGIRYCPDENLSVLDPLQRLGIAGLVDNLCLVGASKRYANDFIEAFLTKEQLADRKERQRFCHFRNPPRAYPLTPGQRSAIERNGAVQVLVHETDAEKWLGLFGCGVTEHWKKYDVGPFNFRPNPVKVAKVEEPLPVPPTPLPMSPSVEDPDDSKDHKRRLSTSSRTHRRRLSSSSLLNLISRTSTSTTRPGSVFGLGGGDKNSSSSSIPPLVSEPPSSPPSPRPASPISPTVDVSSPTNESTKKNNRRSRRMSFIFRSKIPVLSKKHMFSPPVFRSTFGFGKKSPEERRPRTPISLPYDKGHLVSGNRPVSGHRFGLTRIKDTVMRKVDEAMTREPERGMGGVGGVNTHSRRASMYARSSTLLGGSSSRGAMSSAPTFHGSGSGSARTPSGVAHGHGRRASTSATGQTPRGNPNPRRDITASVAHGRRGSTSTTGTVRPLSSRGSVTFGGPSGGLHGNRGSTVRGVRISRASETNVGSIRGSSPSSGSGTETPRGDSSVRGGRTLRGAASEGTSLRPGGVAGTLRGVASERGSLRGQGQSFSSGMRSSSGSSVLTGVGLAPAPRLIATPGTSASLAARGQIPLTAGRSAGSAAGTGVGKATGSGTRK